MLLVESEASFPPAYVSSTLGEFSLKVMALLRILRPNSNSSALHVSVSQIL
jgi:hypothetical protein